MIYRNVAILCVLATPLASWGQVAQNLDFDALPFSEADAGANFKTCGFEFRARVDQSNWLYALQVFVLRSKDGHSLGTLFSSRLNAKSPWKPMNNVIQWVKVGAGDSIEINPYNLVTNPSAGYSSAYSVPKNGDYKFFDEASRPGAVLWVRIFDREKQEHLLIAGTVHASKQAVSVTRQCLKNMTGS